MDHSLSSDDLYRPDFPSLGLFSTWFGVVLIGVTAVLQTGQSSQGSWADPLVEGLQFVLLALILASLFYLPFRAGRGVKWAALPLAINVFTLIIVQLVPFADLWEMARFQVEAGELVPGDGGVAYLAEPYRYLSTDNGRIAIQTEADTTAIFFFNERNAPRNFSGYLYRSDNNPPQQGDFQGRWRYVEQIRPHWYFCIS